MLLDLPDIRTDSFNNDIIVNPKLYTDYTIVVPANGTLENYPNNSVLKLPEIPYLGDDANYPFEIWTGAGKTGSQYNRITTDPKSGASGFYEVSSPLSRKPNEIRFADVDIGTTLYITFYGLGAVAEPSQLYSKVPIEEPDTLANGTIYIGGL